MIFLSRVGARRLAYFGLTIVMSGCGEVPTEPDEQLGEVQQELSNTNNIYSISSPIVPTIDVSRRGSDRSRH